MRKIQGILYTITFMEQECESVRREKCTATDAKYFQTAENLLYVELGVALGKPKQEICKTIIDYINQSKLED